MPIKTSTPTRICLLGEHQDYFGLEVITLAVNLRFSASADKNSSDKINIMIRDSSVSELLQANTDNKYSYETIDLSKPITYENKRDYFKSSVNVLKKAGYSIEGCNIKMDSEIPIGKGMCSSTTMVIAYISALAAANNIILSPEQAAELGWQAEVAEFKEPGGKMDHYASALGGFTHLSFEHDDYVEIDKIDAKADGVFILIDSLQQKDTIKILASAKYPTLEALEQLKPYGVTCVRDFYKDKSLISLLDKLDDIHKRKLSAVINNFMIQRKAYEMFKNGFDNELFGKYLSEHHAQLRDGLGTSTDTINMLLENAIKLGAYGGKVNGSGGGGCLFVYAPLNKAEEIIKSTNKLGFPAAMLKADSGLSITKE